MKRDKFIIILIIIINIIIVTRLYYINVFKHSYYINLYNDITNANLYDIKAPRGKIIDINGNVLVDNIGVKSVIYNKYGINNENELNVVKKLANILELDNYNVTGYMINKYYIFSNSNDSKEAYIYYLMNNGLLYEDKIIKSNISDTELNSIYELELPGISIITTYERKYLYDTCLNDLFGKVGNITKDVEEYYSNLNIKSDDVVGLSYLELYYDSYLRGINGSYSFINAIKTINEYAIPGNDLIISIDINIQLEIEKKLKDEISNAKFFNTAKYYNGSYIVLSDIKGNIVSLVGLKYNNGKIVNDVLGCIYNNYTVGSVVKGASQGLAYKMGVLDSNKILMDSCVKLYSMKEKCSWKDLGRIDDIDALIYSSNYYQFINVFKVLGIDYKYNMKFNVSIDDFNLYRNFFNEFGLGAKTGIDLPKENTGIKGNIISGDLLLNYSIGQYDTYSPLMLNQYISTIANDGDRYKLNIVKEINNNGSISNYNPVLLNHVDLGQKYFNKIKESFNLVYKKGTGTIYSNNKNIACKTGTSQTYFNNIPTITRSFVAYFPYEEPKYSLSIVSPNIYYYNDFSQYNYPINSNISNFILDLVN